MTHKGGNETNIKANLFTSDITIRFMPYVNMAMLISYRHFLDRIVFLNQVNEIIVFTYRNNVFSKIFNLKSGQDNRSIKLLNILLL